MTALCQPADVQEISLHPQLAHELEAHSTQLALAGGPECVGAHHRAALAAKHLKEHFTHAQKAQLRQYADGQLSALLFTDLQGITDDTLPRRLPAKRHLERDFHCLRLASRNQILLHLVRHHAFAYDLDNEGKLIRLVANFKGGGQRPLEHENTQQPVELSSHAGIGLGPHTEAPHHCSLHACDDHSPAPSTLILTARWNPLNEPTRIIPMNAVIDALDARAALALGSPSFTYTRSDSFAPGQGAPQQPVSILEFDEHSGYSIRYNDYRFSTRATASHNVNEAFRQLRQAINRTPCISLNLQPTCALLINNCRTLHGRDSVRDNRRLLIRLFGYSRFARPVVIQHDPLLVRG